MARKKRRRRTTSRRPRRRRTYRRRRNPNPYVVTNRKRTRRRRYRRNPILPTKMIQQAVAVAAGYIVAPRIADMIPFELPGGQLGRWVKQFAVISIGSTVVSKAMGKKYGNALFAGGLIHIGVDALQTYVPAFGGAGLNAYFPPNDELRLMTGNGAAAPYLPGMDSGTVTRFQSRFN